MSKYLRCFFVFTVCVMLITLAFVSCSRKPSEKKTLQVYSYLDLADDTESSNFDTLLDEFKKLYPDISLEFDSLVNELFHNKLQAMNISGQLPDIVLLWSGKRTEQITKSGKMKDLRHG